MKWSSSQHVQGIDSFGWVEEQLRNAPGRQLFGIMRVPSAVQREGDLASRAGRDHGDSVQASILFRRAEHGVESQRFPLRDIARGRPEVDIDLLNGDKINSFIPAQTADGRILGDARLVGVDGQEPSEDAAREARF